MKTVEQVAEDIANAVKGVGMPTEVDLDYLVGRFRKAIFANADLEYACLDVAHAFLKLYSLSRRQSEVWIQAHRVALRRAVLEAMFEDGDECAVRRAIRDVYGPFAA
ncbi:MAG: hypothetical protein LPL29_13375 [Alphaproteobacteria bacterium]|nr:hypothetical protein [Alphaproteobacteria bacterium]